MREYPLRARVTERNTDAHHGVRVVLLDEFDEDIALRTTQAFSFVGWRASGEVGYRGARDEDGVYRREDAAFAE